MNTRVMFCWNGIVSSLWAAFKANLRLLFKIYEHVLAVSCRTLICQYVARSVCLMCLAESLTLVRYDQVLWEWTRSMMSHFFWLGWTARTNSQDWRRRKISGSAARLVCEVVFTMICRTSVWRRSASGDCENGLAEASRKFALLVLSHRMM